MRTFLLWRHKNRRESLPAALVAGRLAALLDPLLATPPTLDAFEERNASLVFARQPTRGWQARLLETDGPQWALAPEYPFGTSGLIDLARRFDRHSLTLLETLQPPFALAWNDGRGDVHVQNDALGQAQLFEFDNGRVSAVTNRISALAALGIGLEPVPEEWAVRLVLGWFPLGQSGYRNVRFVEPATRITFGDSGVERRTVDVLREWVRPEPLDERDCLELARESLARAIRQAAPLWERPSVGLSGGWDTRAVVATLHALGIDFSARVRGAPDRPDVVVATQLACVANFDLRVRSEAGLPPDDADACRRSIARALRWQAGYMVTGKHKTFLSRQAGLDGGVVNVMGQHGEIGRGYYAHKIRADRVPEHEWEDALLTSLLSRTTTIVRPELHEHVRETIRTAFRQADRYELVGRARLDFFYLHERTRRWASGSLNSQDGIVFAPFLNPGYVTAVFAYGGDTTRNPFHRHIVETHSPEWLTVPYATELPKQREKRRRDVGDWRSPRGNRHYDSLCYWRTIGAPLIEEALATGGWWEHVIDPNVARSPDAADALVIARLLPEVLNGLDVANTPANAALAGATFHAQP